MRKFKRVLSLVSATIAILSCCVLSLGNLVMQVNAEEQNVNNSIILDVYRG